MEPDQILPCILKTLYGLIVVNLLAWLESMAKWIAPDVFAKSVVGDVVLITGGGNGIGRLMACKLAAKGATIVTVDVNEKWNEETVGLIRSSGGKAHAYTCDLSDRASVYETFDRIKAEVGAVDILVNNAGIVSGKPVWDTPDSKIDLTFAVNTLAHFWTVKSVLPGMIEKKKGHIVTVSSMAGVFGTSKMVDYCSSKFAAVGFAETLSLELQRTGDAEYIKTTNICPYYIRTPLFQGAKSKVIPILEPEYVAARSVEGILTDTEVVILPWWLKYFVILKSILTMKAQAVIGDAFGINNTMDEFTGRTKKSQ